MRAFFISELKKHAQTDAASYQKVRKAVFAKLFSLHQNLTISNKLYNFVYKKIPMKCNKKR